MKKILLIALLFATAHGDNNKKSEEILLVDYAQKKDQMEGVPYSLKFIGDIPDFLLDEFKKVSLLIKLSDRLPSSITGLGKRADQDKKIFKKVLASKGYLGAKIDFRISPKEDRAVVKFKTDIGDRYKISKIVINPIDNPCLFKYTQEAPFLTALNLREGDIVDFELLNVAGRNLKRYFQDFGYPHIHVDEPLGDVNHKQKTLDVTYNVHTGILTFIKSLEFLGLSEVEEKFISNRFLLKQNDLYSLEKIEKTKGVLSETQLVASILTEISPIDMRDCVLDENQKPIPQPAALNVTVKEMPPRAIGAEVTYATAEKIGGRFYWHHNNLFGHQEHLGILIKSSSLLKKMKISYDLFDFISPLQAFNSQFYIQKETDSLSYSGTSEVLMVGISRPLFNEVLTKGSLSVLLENARLKQDNFLYKENNFSDNHKLTGFPLSLFFDLRNNKTDPTKGIKSEFTFTPYWGQMTDVKHFSQFISKSAYYLPIFKNEAGEDVLVLASFFNFGHLFLAKKATPPLNKRFFGGGSSSIRAYGYKKVSPFSPNSNGNVVFIGGRSMVEFGSELRYKFNSDWGAVVFAEGGYVNNAVYNANQVVKKKILWGPGFGIRYYTAFAPVRVDLAFPMLVRRESTLGKRVDSPYQIYISIGQSF